MSNIGLFVWTHIGNEGIKWLNAGRPEKKETVEGRKEEDLRILINYTLDDLKSATRNFRPDTVLGEGGFGRVFKGWIDKNTFKPSRVGVGIPVAVKKSNPDSLQGLQEWKVCSLLIPQDSCHSDLIRLPSIVLLCLWVRAKSIKSLLFMIGSTSDNLCLF